LPSRRSSARLFDLLTVDNSKTRYVAGEFGVALLVVSVLMADIFLETTRLSDACRTADVTKHGELRRLRLS